MDLDDLETETPGNRGDAEVKAEPESGPRGIPLVKVTEPFAPITLHDYNGVDGSNAADEPDSSIAGVAGVAGVAAVATVATVATAAAVDAPVKKKRGRPRKHPLPPPADPQAPVAKRPRGRPRGSGKHQRAALARSLSGTTSSDQEPAAPQTGDQRHTPPAAVLVDGAGNDMTPVSHAADANGTPAPAGVQDRRRRRKGTRPSRGV